MSSFDIKDTILSQYSNSHAILKLVEGFQDLLDPKAEIELFYNNVFNIMTAQGKGLDIWGEIIGVGRVFKVKSVDKSVIGFNGSELENFNNGVFYSKEIQTDSVILADNAYRELLLIKAAANISRTDGESLTKLLENLFKDRGHFYILEVGLMKLRYVFEFYLTPYEQALMDRRDLPPKPAGVTYEMLQVDPANTFGFAGSNMQPFNIGVFSPLFIQT